MRVYRLIAEAALPFLIQSTVFGQTSTDATHAVLTLQAGGAGTISSVGAEGDLQTGYAIITIDSGTAPYATAVLTFTQNGIVVSVVGVPASPPTLSARFFVDFRTGITSGSGTMSVNTGIAVVNMGSDRANIKLLLRDLQGNTLSSGTIQLAAGGHFAKFIDQFAPDFVLRDDFLSAIALDRLTSRAISRFPFWLCV